MRVIDLATLSLAGAYTNWLNTGTLFNDALTEYSGSTVSAPWTLQGGSFTFGSSGATSGSTGSYMTAGNAQWKPLLGSDGTTKLALTVQTTVTTPSPLASNDNGILFLWNNGINNNYYVILNAYQVALHKIVGGSDSQLASASYTPSISTSYVLKLSLDNTGILTAHLQNTGGTDLVTPLTFTDSNPLTGGFLIGVGGDTGVVISNASVTGPVPTSASAIAEAKIPLWWADGTYANCTDNTGNYKLQDGSATAVNSNGSQVQLFTLSSSWPASTKIAFEGTLYASNASYYAYLCLYDITASALLSANQIQTKSTTATVIRSGQFTLTPNHAYGVSIFTQTSGTANATDASLIIFPS